jgi:hypothetical protein
MWRFRRTYGYGDETGIDETELDEERKGVVVAVVVVVKVTVGELTIDEGMVENRGRGVDVAFVVVSFGDPAAFGGAPKPVHMEGRGIVRD